MKVFIKNELISVGGDSEVLNENHEPVFTVKGKVFTVTKKKKMYDMEGNLLYVIRNKYWRLFNYKVFVIDASGNRVATIKKGKFSFSRKFKILGTQDEMSIEGKFFNRNSQIMKNGQPVATMRTEFSLMNDAYSLEADDKDIAFYTALVIAFDNLKDKMTDSD